LIHDVHGEAILNDNRPFHEHKLAAYLDDGLTPQDWLQRLNSKVFFWTDQARLDGLLGARMNRDRPREILVVNTLTLVSAHYGKVAISPINSGSTLRKPARRGEATFASLPEVRWPEWRRRRGKKGPDKIVEVIVEGGVPDIADYVDEVRCTQCAEVVWRPHA